MVRVHTAHTADLGRATLDAVRGFLETAFAGDFSADDWDHALGGVHALAWAGGELVGHGSVVQRRLLHGGRALRAGYVEGMAVHAGHRRAGVGAAVIRELRRVIDGAYELGALSSTEEGLRFYAAQGWAPWRGPTSALTPGGVVRTPDEDGAVHVVAVDAPLDLDGELVCDWRDGAPW